MNALEFVEQTLRNLTRTHKALVGAGSGIALVVMGVNGWLGDIPTTLLGAVAGLLIFVLSVLVLLAAHGGRLAAPYPYIAVPVALAAGLHLYETYLGYSFGWLAWRMTPYVLALAISCFGAARFSAVVGAFAALLADIWLFGSAFTVPVGLVSAMTMTLMPLWNMLILGPAATWVVWLLYERRTWERVH